MFASWNSSSWTTKEEPLFVFLFEEWFTRNYRKQRFLWFVPIRKNHLFERTILQEPQEFQARRNGSFALLLVSRRTAFFSSSPFLFFFLNPTVSFLETNQWCSSVLLSEEWFFLFRKKWEFLFWGSTEEHHGSFKQANKRAFVLKTQSRHTINCFFSRESGWVAKGDRL